MKLRRREFFKLSAASSMISMTGLAKTKGDRDVVYKEKTVLKTSVSEMKDFYDTVVIGSGYGGSVAASGLAEEGSLCLLERGQEYHPGDFPEFLSEVIPFLKSPFHKLGLFGLDYYGDATVVSGSGLGGTSLINQSLATIPDDDVFDIERWPDAIRNDRDQGALSGYYRKAKGMLRPGVWPEEQPLPGKAQTMSDTAEALGLEFKPSPIYVNYSEFDKEKNHVGVFQNPCTLCGNCLTGCNVGAKNTLNMNYIPDAKNKGAHIFTGIDVRYFKKLASGRYRIYFDQWYSNRKGKSHKRIFGKKYIDTARLIVSAGTLGSNKILMRSQKYGGMQFSSKLGHYFSGNGDTIGMGFNGDQRTDIESYGNRITGPNDPTVGPASIGYTTHNPSSPEPTDRFVVEDSSVPLAVVSLLKSGLFAIGGIPDSLQDIAKIFSDVIKRAPDGALNHSQLYLGVGHDDSNGEIKMSPGGKFKIAWDSIKNDPIWKRINEGMKQHSDKQGANFIENPLGMVTTHPLGGCAMGEDVSSGVVDHQCRVFNPQGGIHEQLYVMDGSVIPHSLGTNPSLTITALAERAVDLIKKPRFL